MSAEMQLAHAFVEAHAARAAIVLERMPLARASAVLRTMPARSSTSVLAAMTPPFAAGVLAHFDGEDAAPLVQAMPMDDAAAVLRALPREQRAPLLAALSAEARGPLERALHYPDGTAGAVMDPSVLHLPDEILVAEAQTRIRRATRELLYYLYVVDRDHRLVGVLDIPELMAARPRDPVSAAMHRQVDRLSAWTPTSIVREHRGWFDYHAMPVVDEQDRLVGAIRYQALRRLEREAAVEGPDPAELTTSALGELFRLATTGLVAGVAPASPVDARQGTEARLGDGAGESTDA